MFINETLCFVIPEVEDEPPGQLAEFRMQQVRDELIAFVYRVTTAHTVSDAEGNFVRLEIAMRLIQSLQADAATKVLTERLLGRVS